MTIKSAVYKQSERKRSDCGKYEICQDCGAHLDHGEKCDCAQDNADERQPAEDKPYCLHI